MLDLYKKIRIYGLKQTLIFAGSELKYKYYQLIHNAYGQNQEDLVIDKFLNYKPNGFYVDIGAYDPHRFSNTKRFYLKGWRGINIEPDVHNYQKFLQKRPADKNLNLGIADKPGVLTFYKMFPPTISTFSKKEAQEYQKQGYELIAKIKVKTTTLANVLNKYAKNKQIDFMSVDTEGFDLIVLKSNNWKKFKPQIICVESENNLMSKNNKAKERIHNFLLKQGYHKEYDNGLNSIYG